MASYSITSIDSNTTLDGDIEYIIIDATNNNITCTLPAIGSDGESYTFKRIDSAPLNTVTLVPQGMDTINGGASQTMDPGQSFRIISLAGNYNLILG